MATTDAPLRWGILATGGIASAFTAELKKMPDAEVAAVASRSTDRAKLFADRFDIPQAYGSWADMAADDSLDVVYVAAPHSAHRAAAGLCLQAGRAVLCEKSFTLNAAEAAELIALARTHDSFLMEAMWMYCNPLIRRLAALVHDGAIGEVRTIHADFGLQGPFAAAHRLRDPAQGGGALLDLGVYPVSFAHLLLGEPGIVQATALLSQEGVDLNTGMLLGWPDRGALATLTCSVTAGTPVTASVTGTKGRIDVPYGFFYPERFTLHRNGHAPQEVVAAPDAPHDSLRHEAAEVMRCLRAGEKESPLVPLDGSLAVMRTLDAVRDRIGVRYPDEP
ncbi:Gfo/Idh/MocA family oxidoreductase [Streptomyces sp. NBC_00237]|uniref:Gfo/Idh/MocA family protein n=1 Tax=Streptomyces sp. NBC_00237 TaxID=2975687 RepID=UPI00224C8B85|nr:Gfo/Idh/MocA family oxidoreductase [Streptomyces sp. NBC_00237]MCX5201575.1 Gfo/Idh/MocA family oxidoreductase [Streptomyces sp. NBC_00237]